MNTVFIYELFNPINNTPFYIGQTNNLDKRLKAHIRDIKYKNVKIINIEKVNIIEEILSNNMQPQILVIDKVNLLEWQFWEKHYISLYKSFGFKLTNVTNGGEGGDNFNSNIRKDEIRKIKSIQSKQLHAAGILKGFQQILTENPAINEKKNNNIRKRWQDENFKQQQIKKMKAGFTIETFNKMSISMKNTLNSAEKRKLMSERTKKLWQDEEYRLNRKLRRHRNKK